jgi:NADH/F420H2 dehydrogenase subunit C
MQEMIEQIRRHAPDAVLESREAFGETTLLIARDAVVSICRLLRDEPSLAYAQLSDLTAVDWPDAPERFEVVYHLNSLSHRRRLRLKARVPASPCEIDSVTGVWQTANFLEREVFDLMGIRFRGHPDLRRIMMPEDYEEGHPLRKDFPATGKGWRNTFEFWPAMEPGQELMIDATALGLPSNEPQEPPRHG